MHDGTDATREYLALSLQSYYNDRSKGAPDQILPSIMEAVVNVQKNSKNLSDYLIVSAFLEGQEQYQTALDTLADAEINVPNGQNKEILLPDQKLRLLTALNRHDEARDIFEQILNRGRKQARPYTPGS